MLGCMLCLPALRPLSHARLKFGATFGGRVDSVTPSAPIFTPACAYLFLCRLANHNSYQTCSDVHMYEYESEVFFCGDLLPQRRGRLQRWGDHSQIAPPCHRGHPRVPPPRRIPFTLFSPLSFPSLSYFLTQYDKSKIAKLSPCFAWLCHSVAF